MGNQFALAGPGSKFKLPDAQPAGFWAGYWHGMIAPVAFLVSLFNEKVGIYETHNTGKWYDLGFVLGATSTAGSRVQIGSKPKKHPASPDEDTESE